MEVPTHRPTRVIIVAILAAFLFQLLPPLCAGPTGAACVSWDWKDTGGPGTGTAYGVEFDPANGNIYMAGGPEGLWRRDASGWKDLQAPCESVDCIAFDPSRDLLYIGTTDGIWRCNSPDSSPSFTRLASLETRTDLAYDQAHNVLYAAGRKVYRCAGPDASPTCVEISDDYLTRLAYDPTHDVLYAGQFSYMRCDNPRIAPRWTGICDSHQEVSSLAYDSAHDLLFATELDQYGGTGGVYRLSSPRSSPARQKIRSDRYLSCVTYDAGRDEVYAAGDGVARCTNHDGEYPRWVDLGGGLSDDSTVSLAFDAAGDTLFTGSTHRGVHRCSTPDATPSWSDTGYAFGSARGFSFAYDGTRDILYAAGWRVWRCDNPRTAPIWTDITSDLPDSCTRQVNGAAYDNVHNILYAGTGDGAWRCAGPDVAPSWSRMGEGPYGEMIYDGARDALYGQQGECAARCLDPSASANWTAFVDPGGESSSLYMTDMAFDPRKNTLYVASTYSVNECPGARIPCYVEYKRTLSIANPQGDPSGSVEYDGYGAPLAVDSRRGVVWATDEFGRINGMDGYPQPDQLCVDEARNVLYKSGRGIQRCVQPGSNNSTWAPTGGAIADSSTGSMLYDENHRLLYAATSRGVWYASPVPVPAISAITPAIGYPGQRMTVGLKGVETRFVKGRSRAAFSSPDIRVNSINVLSATEAVADITIAPDARCQISSVTVSTDGVEAVPVEGGFSIFSKYSFAEGTCRPGFDTYVCISGQGPVQVDFYTASGNHQSTGEFYAQGRTTINCADILGRGDDEAHDFSIVVYALSDQSLVVERSMYFDYGGITGGDATMSAAPEPRFYFAEGTCRPGFDPYFCLFNPGDSRTEVKLTYMKGDGSSVVQTVPVEPGRRATVRAREKLGEADDAAHDFSTTVETLDGSSIVAERATYFAYKGVWTGGHCVVGAATPEETLFFAEGTCRPGFDPYLTVQNPGASDASVKVTYLRGNGEMVLQDLHVPARTRSTLHPSDVLGSADDAAHDFSIKLESTNGEKIIAERPMYFDYRGWDGGHDVVGTSAPAEEFRFAEGTARPGFDTYVSLLNPNRDATHVLVTYVKSGGYNESENIVVPGRSRATLHPADLLGRGDDDGHDFAIRVKSSAGMPLVVERPMYFDYKGWTGGSDVMGNVY